MGRDTSRCWYARRRERSSSTICATASSGVFSSLNLRWAIGAQALPEERACSAGRMFDFPAEPHASQGKGWKLPDFRGNDEFEEIAGLLGFDHLVDEQAVRAIENAQMSSRRDDTQQPFGAVVIDSLDRFGLQIPAKHSAALASKMQGHERSEVAGCKAKLGAKVQRTQKKARNFPSFVEVETLRDFLGLSKPASRRFSALAQEFDLAGEAIEQ